MTDILVPFLDLGAEHKPIQRELERAFQDVVANSHFILGPKVKELETELAKYLGAKHAIGCASGSDALLLALMAYNIGPGDEVITSTFTFFATAGTIARTGATPVFVDIDPHTYNLTPAGVKAAITNKTKAVMPVHLSGLSCDMNGLKAVCGKIPIIEDACQAIGADYKGKKAGVIGDIGAYSFFPTKNLGGFGDGGLVTTNDDALADKMRKLRVHGSHPKYYHHMIGLNSRLDEIQAAILLVKFKYLPDYLAGRRAAAKKYDAQLEGIVQIPMEPKDYTHVYHLYTIRTPKRDALSKHLQEHQIASGIYYPVPLHLQACFEYLGYTEGDLPESEKLSHDCLSLPIFPELTDAQINHVTKSIAQFF